MQHVIFEGVRSDSLYFKIVLTRAAVTYQHALGFDLTRLLSCAGWVYHCHFLVLNRSKGLTITMWS